MWDGLVGFEHPACLAMLGEEASTLQRWVNTEPRIRFERFIELRVSVRRGLRLLAILCSWWKEAKERIMTHTLYRPGGSGYLKVASTTLVGKKRDTCDECRALYELDISYIEVVRAVVCEGV